MIKTREELESNYKAIWSNGKTLRFAINASQSISELKHPEFYDIKITNTCTGGCPECYMDSKPSEIHFKNIVEKVQNFFGPMTTNERPFQLAIGGGEPTEHPDFFNVVKTIKELDIVPNYTTNGMWSYKDESVDELLDITEKNCGGVAVSCHPHLEQYWIRAAKLLSQRKVKLNFHIIISDKDSIDYFMDIFDLWKDKVDYFVLLPYGIQGRAKPKEIDWEYLVSVFPKNIKENKKIAFGANFYPYLLRKDLDINVSLYEPELFSKFISLEGNGKLYKSSFSDKVIQENIF
jgi:organic radical activating enzyme